ncbi:MAG: DUF3829 domain-containing protein [Ignavibacteriae bacterium]|nr:MAG: DUF3829 domain-containing protein [Ignavibacteriota bacterium]
MNKAKFFISLLIIISVSLSCSLFNSLKEKISSKKDKEQKWEDTDKEETVSENSGLDLAFYNKYIEVINKVQESIENIHKSYIENVPDPKSLSKSSFILVITADMYVNNLERDVKEFKRSLYDNGELSKLETDNKEMKNDIENEFRHVLTQMEEYHKTARKVIDYYKNKDYEKDLSLAAGYDTEMKDQWEKSKTAYEKLAGLVKKYKPKREYRDPDKISNPDKKSMAVLMNAYENTLEEAEAFHEKFERADKNSNWSDITASLDDFEKGFKAETDKVNSTEYTETTKFLKYSYEDYFTKTVNDFVKEARSFINKVQSNKLNEREFNTGYDDVVRYYNYMINAYNTSTQTLNTYQNLY